MAKNVPGPVVVIETSMGTIKAELWQDKAPQTVMNFLRYADEAFFDGLTFHRVIANFMIQGGGMDKDMQQKPTHEPIQNEATSELKNRRGTLAMARTNRIHSATSQFFINLVDNDFLDHTSETPDGFGYCAFGKVIEGMDVVDAIAKVRTTRAGGHQDVPAAPVEIRSIRRAQVS
jgi:peptidyl-prolyl cis-trans isomerase B (cyclophilin B)